MSAYEKVQAARAPERPTALACIEKLLTDFVELHGDRRYGDDRAVVAGIGRLGGESLTVVGLEKGRGTKERIARNFGSAHPEGYRKAIRLFRQAEKFRRPVLCLVDTSGAYCGVGAEERGQGQAIAESMATLIGLKTPVISVILGEGGSGGALALAVADGVWIFENAIYSVLSPEGAASILWKDAARVREASEALKLTASDLMALGAVDRVIEETGGFDEALGRLGEALKAEFARLRAIDPEALVRARYEKYRRIGGPCI